MYFNRPNNLDSPIEVKATNRPIKIVYQVPYEESDITHLVIDAVFYESYTRWGGARTLIIPTNNNCFLFKEYEDWLKFYDPDFIYAYVDLEQGFIEKLENVCSPIAFLSYKNNKLHSSITRWRDYLPVWHHYFEPISSLTTIHSPYAGYRQWPGTQKEEKKIVITQYHSIEEERFVIDNFGIAFDLHTYPNPIPGIFETCCLVPKDLSERMYAGSERIFSPTDVILNIASKKAVTISMLAMAHSKSIPRVEPYRWAQNFNLFIGDSCLDRIHFWNARNFSPDYIDVPGALLVNKSLIEYPDFVNQLGQFLNNHNFLGHQNGPRIVALRSYSHSKQELDIIRDIINKRTHNQVILADPYDNPAIPSAKDYTKYRRGGTPDVTIFKITEDINKIQAAEPEHFNFIPAKFKGLSQGQWAIELVIQRHNSLSRYSNVIDTWKLPYRRKGTRAFTNNLAKVSRDNLLTILPVSDTTFLISRSVKNPYFFNLLLPEDENFFRCLFLDISILPSDDLRSFLKHDTYKDLGVSDKGQNLRGVISMFDTLSDASEILTNKFWREVLRDERNKVDGIYSYNELKGFLRINSPLKSQLKEQLHFNNIGEVPKYLDANLKDTLEFLINKRVFYQVHQWRCSYCGHTNMQTLDNLKKENVCEICNLKYFAPIDLEWKYKLNDFVYRSLREHNGLTVLWALGHLQDRYLGQSFFYLPEVDLFREYNIHESKNEIDILCVLEGMFYAVEVKLSAIGFTEKLGEIDKYIEKILLIKPDVALLAFEQYSESKKDIGKAKQKLKEVVGNISMKIGKYIKVETVIASDYPQFNEHPVDLGRYGDRVNKIRLMLALKKGI